MTTSIPSAQPGLYRLCFGHQPWWWVPLSFTGMSRQLHEGNQCHLTVTTCPCRRRKEWWNWNLMEGNKPTLSTWTFDALKSWREKLQGHLNPVPASYVTTCQTRIFCTEKGGHPFTCVLSWLIRASFEITNKLDISDTLHSLDFRVEQHFLGTVSPFSSLNESEMRIITVVAWLWQTLLKRPHGLQHFRPPCPLLSPGVCSKSCPSSQWCHPTISSSVPFSFYLQSFPTSGSFPMSWLFTSGGQSIGVSVLPMNIQG